MQTLKKIGRGAMLGLCAFLAGCFGGAETFSVKIDRPVERVYAQFSELPLRGSALREMGLSAISVNRQKPADNQIVYVIPAADGNGDSQLTLSFMPTKDGGTQIDAQVVVPAYEIKAFNGQVIDDAKVAAELEKHMNRMGEAMEKGKSMNDSAMAFNAVLDSISIISNPALLEQFAGMTDFQNGLFDAGLDDHQNDIDYAASNGDAMSDPDLDASATGEVEATDEAGGW